MVIEINVASICASVPIFWPVLRPFFGAIFVTHEFGVEYETRESISSHDRADLESGSKGHYEDSYIMDLVNPLAFKDKDLAKSKMGNETSGTKTTRWYKL